MHEKQISNTLEEILKAMEEFDKEFEVLTKKIQAFDAIADYEVDGKKLDKIIDLSERSCAASKELLSSLRQLKDTIDTDEGLLDLAYRKHLRVDFLDAWKNSLKEKSPIYDGELNKLTMWRITYVFGWLQASANISHEELNAIELICRESK